MLDILSDGQYWGLCLLGAMLSALAAGLVGYAAELIREGAK